MRFSNGFECVDLASVLAARAANVESFKAAVENPSRGKLAATMKSLCGFPTDRSGIGIEYRSGTKLKVPFS